MTRLSNKPTGWEAFRAFRKEPAPVFERRHGNWKHGCYSKEHVAGMRMVRLCTRVLNGRIGDVEVPELVRRQALGWAAYRTARGQKARLR